MGKNLTSDREVFRVKAIFLNSLSEFAHISFTYTVTKRSGCSLALPYFDSRPKRSQSFSRNSTRNAKRDLYLRKTIEKMVGKQF